MLNAFYGAIFGQNVPHQRGGAWVWFAAVAMLALNAAVQLQVGFFGLLAVLLLFMFLGLIGCFWYLASVHFWAMCFGSHNRTPSLSPLSGLWPFILLGPALSAQQLWPTFGNLLTAGTVLMTLITLAAALKGTYQLNWVKASFSLALTLALLALAGVGIWGWVFMLMLGIRNFGIMIVLTVNFFQF